MKMYHQLTRFSLFCVLIACFLSCSDDDDPQKTNTAPVIAAQSFSIAENSKDGTSVGTVTATDADAETTLTYSLKSGNTGQAFAINSATGEITVNNFDALDYETSPTFSLTVEVTDGEDVAAATITITLTDVADGFASAAEVTTALAACHADLKEYIEFTYLFDAIYSTFTPSPNAAWNDISTHQQTAGNAKVYRLWADAYDIIYTANNVIESADLIADQDQRNNAVAQARMIRAYLFLELINWFGPVPLDLAISDSQLARLSTTNITAFLISELTAINGALPSVASNDDFSSYAAKALLAQVYLYNSSVELYTPLAEGIINDMQFSLSENADVFSASSDEIIYGFAVTDDSEFSAFFTKGYVPVFRLTEVHLIAAEGNVFVNNSPSVKQYLDPLALRRGSDVVNPGASNAEQRELVFGQWKTEMIQEGAMLSTHKRFNATAALGLSTNQLLMPIPTAAQEANPNLTQNVGYN